MRIITSPAAGRARIDREERMADGWTKCRLDADAQSHRACSMVASRLRG
jgi:hypothetical protein